MKTRWWEIPLKQHQVHWSPWNLTCDPCRSLASPVRGGGVTIRLSISGTDPAPGTMLEARHVTPPLLSLVHIVCHPAGRRPISVPSPRVPTGRGYKALTTLVGLRPLILPYIEHCTTMLYLSPSYLRATFKREFYSVP